MMHVSHFGTAPRAGDNVLINCDDVRGEYYDLDDIVTLEYDAGRDVWRVTDASGYYLTIVQSDRNSWGEWAAESLDTQPGPESFEPVALK